MSNADPIWVYPAASIDAAAGPETKRVDLTRCEPWLHDLDGTPDGWFVQSDLYRTPGGRWLVVEWFPADDAHRWFEGAVGSVVETAAWWASDREVARAFVRHPGVEPPADVARIVRNETDATDDAAASPDPAALSWGVDFDAPEEQPPAEAAANREAPGEPAALPGPKPKLRKEDLAMAVLTRRAKEGRSIAVKDVAGEAGCSASYLYRCQNFMDLVCSHEGDPGDVPKGRKDGATGDVEAWSELVRDDD